MIVRNEARKPWLFPDQDIEKIHRSSLRILEEIGIDTNSERIREIFYGIGAKVDNHWRIRVDPILVEKALENAPATVTLSGRDTDRNIVLKEGNVYFGFGGTPPPYFRDTATGEIRRPGKDDVAAATRLADGLPHISFVMSIAGAYDVSHQVQYLHELQALFNNTTKPIVYIAPGAKYAQKALQMAELVKSPQGDIPFALFSESTSPFRFSEINENIIECAKRKVPVVFGAGPMLGVTGPVTVAGAFAIANAETLFALVLSQAVQRGTPFVYGPHVTAIDMRTSQVCYAAPESAIARSMLTQLAGLYKLPSFAATGFGVDSKCPDAQAGVEAATNAMACVLSGAHLIQNVGTMAHGSYGSMNMAVICDEVIGMLGRIWKKVDVNEYTVPVSVMREVGPGGNFLLHEHTLNSYREELFTPSLFDRSSHHEWTKMGSKSIDNRAQERVEHILAQHQVRHLPADIQQQLDKLIAESRTEFAGEIKNKT